MTTDAGSGSGAVEGRVALVTGASSGMGARIAAVLHAAGADVVLTATHGRTGWMSGRAGSGPGSHDVPGDLPTPLSGRPGRRGPAGTVVSTCW